MEVYNAAVTDLISGAALDVRGCDVPYLTAAVVGCAADAITVIDKASAGRKVRVF
jgi:hypothetical protein